MRHALRRLDCKREDTAIIGDRMDTDIISGINSDIDTVPVLGGVTSREDLKRFATYPRYVLDGVGEIPIDARGGRMEGSNEAFSRSYRYYLDQLGALSMTAVARKAGGSVHTDHIAISMFGDTYGVSADGITDTAGNRPPYDICVILSRYLLMCADTMATEDKCWAHFRDFKDSGPLLVYFANDVEGAISRCYAGRVERLKKAGMALGGRQPAIDAAYDLAQQFDALPRIPVVMLFNDADEAFPATCSLLFESRAATYLDPECIAMLGRQLFVRLKTVLGGDA